MHQEHLPKELPWGWKKRARRRSQEKVPKRRLRTNGGLIRRGKRPRSLRLRLFQPLPLLFQPLEFRYIITCVFFELFVILQSALDNLRDEGSSSSGDWENLLQWAICRCQVSSHKWYRSHYCKYTAFWRYWCSENLCRWYHPNCRIVKVERAIQKMFMDLPTNSGSPSFLLSFRRWAIYDKFLLNLNSLRRHFQFSVPLSSSKSGNPKLMSVARDSPSSGTYIGTSGGPWEESWSRADRSISAYLVY